MPFHLAAVQFRPEKGDMANNYDRITHAIKQSASEGADLVLFPESCTTGYILEGGVDELAQTPLELTQELQSRLQDFHQQVDFSIGYYEKSDGRPYNSAAYFNLNQGKLTLLHNYRKFFLPTYKVFDEARFMRPGNELGVVETRFGRIGILICEDVWHSALGSLLCVAGCHTILVHSASPARGFAGEKPANVDRYERMLSALAEEHGMFVAMAMLTGFEGGKGLVGGSIIISPFGQTLTQAQIMGEQIIIAPIDPDDCRLARNQTPLASDLATRWADIARLAQQLANPNSKQAD